MDKCNPCVIPMCENVKLVANMSSKEVDPTFYKKYLGNSFHLTIRV
jgi:hypothetical protein